MPRLDPWRLRPDLTRFERALPRPALALLVVLAGTIVGAAVGAAEEGPRARNLAPPEAVAPPASQAEAPPPAPSEPAPPAAIPASLLAGLHPLTHEAAVVDGEARRVAGLGHGGRAVLTLDAPLQAHLEDELARFEVPFGAAVALEPATGRVLAYVSHSSAHPGAGDLARDPTPPTASVFKVVTAAALIDAGIGRNRRVCYAGGARRIVLSNLEDQDRDRRCATFGEAMGRSINAVFAKLADRHIDQPTLARYAEAFGFGHALPFDVPTRASPVEIPGDRLERARTAAGFWHAHMSPLHGALIAATVANEGRMPRAAIVDRVEDAAGEVLARHEPEVFRAVIPRRTARTLTHMMENTVQRGTARRAFFDNAGRAFLPGVAVAGKTGTLSSERPYRGYTWFIGFAPAEAPTIAVATLVVNTPEWRIKASYLAREALRQYLRRPAGR